MIVCQACLLYNSNPARWLGEARIWRRKRKRIKRDKKREMAPLPLGVVFWGDLRSERRGGLCWDDLPWGRRPFFLFFCVSFFFLSFFRLFSSPPSAMRARCRNASSGRGTADVGQGQSRISHAAAGWQLLSPRERDRKGQVQIRRRLEFDYSGEASFSSCHFIGPLLLPA